MKGILLVARRDFWAYINTVWGWAILALALLLDGVFFNVFGLTGTAQYSADVLDQFVFFTSGIALAAAVLITMRLFAEERQTGTIVLLDSSPLSEAQIVLGKYLSGMAFLAFFALLTAYMPAMIFVNGKVSVEQIAVGYLGILLVGSAGVGIGTWASAISRNQLLAAVISTVVTVFFVTCWMLARVTDAPFKAIISYLAFFDKHLQPFQEGRIDTQGVFFFVSLTFAFLLLANRSLIARRWE
ncbi:MAG: ABC transporter permease subunit [Pseudomonadota bacterium]|nr:ABC transporter permease subunit [Pseudomonadota bacterium]